MKNKLTAVISSGILFVFGAGCGFWDAAQNVTNSNSNKTIIEQIGDQVAGVQKTGIPECDEVLDKIEQSQATDNSFAGQIAREVAKRAIASQVNENLASKTPEERQAIALACKQIGAQFDAPANK